MPAPTVENVDVLAKDELIVFFSSSVKNDANLQNPANYTVAPEFDGQAVTVKKVHTGHEVYTDVVYLEITAFTVGEQYQVTVSNSIVGVDGVALSASEDSARFIGRRTKVDSILASLPKAYDKRPGSVIRCLLAAVAREDDILAGSQQDDFRIPE